MEPIRTLKSLAQDAKLSERQFARLLKLGDERACGPLRAELACVLSADCQNVATDMQSLAGDLERCDPKLAAMLNALAGKLRQWVDTAPPNPWRDEREERLSALATDPSVSDELYEQFEGDLSCLPPKLADLKKDERDALAGLLE